MSDDKDIDVTSEGAPEAAEPKPRKLQITKRSVRQFKVRSGLQTGLAPTGGGSTSDTTTAYWDGYRDSGSTYYGR